VNSPFLCFSGLFWLKSVRQRLSSFVETLSAHLQSCITRIRYSAGRSEREGRIGSSGGPPHYTVGSDSHDFVMCVHIPVDNNFYYEPS
jgi:hypothetical protein